MTRPVFAAAFAMVGALALAPLAAEAACLAPQPEPALRVATVGEDDPRIFFLADADMARGCPRDASTCRTRAFVVPGDVVLVAGVDGDYACATFRNAQGATTTGWLPVSSLAMQAAPRLSARDWVGSWTAPEQEIAITADRAGALVLRGDATWGAADPERVKRGGVNIGEFEATSRLPADALAFTVGNAKTLPYDQGDDTDCRLKMLRRGPYLVVADNNQCGGHNVTFRGIYRRGT